MNDKKESTTHYVLCDTCGENLGDYRPFFAEGHLKEYPEHKQGFSVLVKNKKLAS